MLKLDTTLPGFYNRDFTIRGTEGAYFQAFNGYLNAEDHSFNPVGYIRENMDSAEKYKEMLPSQWLNITEEEKESGHGGMDELVFNAFFEALDQNKPMPIDVYDMATWMCITVLSEQSLLTGQQVAFPDFTEGKWILRKNEFEVE